MTELHAVFPLAVGAAQGVLEVGEAEVAEHLLDDVRDLLVLEDAAVSIDDLDEYVECLQDIIDGARAQGIPADAIVAESAPAQFEVNLVAWSVRLAGPSRTCPGTSSTVT